MTPEPDFQVVAQPFERFAYLFSLTDEALTALGARRMTVDHKPGYPCRVSLEDAEVGEEVILTPFRHHAVASPYRGAGPIFVRASARTAKLNINTLPTMLLHRLLSLRAYGEAGMMTGAQVVEGASLEEAIQSFFADEKVVYLHVHNAGPGCFNCLVERA